MCLTPELMFQVGRRGQWSVVKLRNFSAQVVPRALQQVAAARDAI